MKAGLCNSPGVACRFVEDGGQKREVTQRLGGQEGS